MEYLATISGKLFRRLPDGSIPDFWGLANWRNVRSGQRFLIAAWAFACGLGYYSFFGQLRSLRSNEPDPAPISSEWVAVIKGVAWAIAILALIVSLKASPEASK